MGVTAERCFILQDAQHTNRGGGSSSKEEKAISACGKACLG